MCQGGHGAHRGSGGRGVHDDVWSYAARLEVQWLVLTSGMVKEVQGQRASPFLRSQKTKIEDSTPTRNAESSRYRHDARVEIT